MGIIIAGFGISMVLQNVAFLIWTARAVPFPVSFGPALEIGELMLPRSYLWIVVVTLVLSYCAVALSAWLSESGWTEANHDRQSVPRRGRGDNLIRFR
jgi:branched-subunit amino acid ABC-type transport system permease component